MMDGVDTSWDARFVWDEVFRPTLIVGPDGDEIPRTPGRVEAVVRMDLARLVDQSELEGLTPTKVALAISLAGRVDAGDSVYSTAKELRALLDTLDGTTAPRSRKVKTPDDDDDLSTPE